MNIHSFIATVSSLSSSSLTCLLLLLLSAIITSTSVEATITDGTVCGTDVNLYAVDISGLQNQFNSFQNEFETSISITSDIQSKMDVVLPLVDTSFDEFIGGDVSTHLQSMFSDMKSFVTNLESSLTGTCYTDSVTITTCEDDDNMEIVFDKGTSSLKVTLCPTLTLPSTTVTLNPSGLFDSLEDSYELVVTDDGGAQVAVDVTLGFRASVTFSLDSKKQPVYNNDITFTDAFTADITVDGTADIILALGMVDLTSTANVKFNAVLSLTPESDDSVTFDAQANYELNGNVAIGVDIDGIDDLSADASFSIVEADIYNPNPIVSVDAPNLTDMVKLSPKNAVKMLHVIDSALVRAQENQLFESVNVPITDKKLSDIFATGSVLTNR